MKLNDLYDEVARQADTEGTQINVAVTKRVIATLFTVLEPMDSPTVAAFIAKGLSAACLKRGRVAKKKYT